LIKTTATQGLTPDNVLTRVNEDLSLDNPSLMFVTLFLGILNIRTGKVVYCNGGHNPPYIIRSDGGVAAVESTHGMALGVMEDFVYNSKSFTLGKGESLFIYTDGVTEAMNGEEELYSEERLEAALIDLQEASVTDIIGNLMKTIHRFSRDVPQSDDITMMMIRYNGS
ncbi:MAG: serine/threonine-protein phosphatase, partial [Deltaproteobacteria bacterium]|nr:serine/threonine-protein phosphatase [Deltaproteobacteria bacterium]